MFLRIMIRIPARLSGIQRYKKMVRRSLKSFTNLCSKGSLSASNNPNPAVSGNPITKARTSCVAGN